MQKTLTLLTASLALGFPAAAAEMPSNLVSLTTAELSAWMAENCESLERTEIVPTRFPFARESEVYQHCRAEGAEILVTFADGERLMTEVRGDISGLIPAEDPAFEIETLQVFPQDFLLIDQAASTARIFANPQVLTLFAFWENPAWSGHARMPDGEWFLPPEIVFGASIEDFEAALEPSCGMTMTRPIEEIWLPTEPAEQHQIDCFGYEIAGYPRKVEFIFGDGILQQVWLMVGDADIERLRDHFTALHGEPTSEDETYIVFGDWTLALRKDVPEILIGSDELQQIWRVEGN